MASSGSTSAFEINIMATANLISNRFVSSSGGVPVVGGNTLGVIRHPVSSGTTGTVDVLGTAVVETGGIIAQYATIGVDALGRAVTWTSGAKVGQALFSGVSGDFIEVLLIPNVA